MQTRVAGCSPRVYPGPAFELVWLVPKHTQAQQNPSLGSLRHPPVLTPAHLSEEPRSGKGASPTSVK